MEFVRKVIITAVVASMPLTIAALINIATDQSALAQAIDGIKGEFLRTVQRIDGRLDRIENKLDRK